MALLEAAKSGDTQRVRALIDDKGMHPDDQKDWHGTTSLILASQGGHRDVVEVLLSHKGDPNHQNNFGDTSLIFASGWGPRDSIQLLLSQKADPHNQNKNGDTSLILASKRGHRDCMQLLLNYKADPHHENQFGRSPIILSSKGGHRDCIQLLLNRKADPNHQDQHGNTSLILASKGLHRDCMQLLLTHKADPNHQNKFGRAPLIWASQEGHRDCMQLLLNHKADPNHQDQNGDTSLIMASLGGYRDCMQLLLIHKADPRRRNKSNKSALSYANKEIKTLLMLLMEIPVDFKSAMARLALDRWNPKKPRTVTLRNWGLTDATIHPVWQWQGVVRLNLSRNNLRVLPENFNFPNLRDLDVSHNKLETLPNRLLLLPKLAHLKMSHNKLQELPNIDLAVLEELNLSINETEKNSTQLSLSRLKSLDLSHNELRDVAAAMKQLCGPSSKLKSIRLKGNKNLKVPPSQIIDRGGKKVCQFFKDLTRGRKICWSQTVLVVGQEEAGKTALCHALSGHRCADHAQMTEASTVGIDVVRWSIVVAIPRTNRGKSTSSSIAENMVSRVSHPRMVTRAIGFRAPDSVFKQTWIKADVELRGSVLSLTQTSNDSARKRALEAFHIEREMLCTLKGVFLLQLDFPATQRTLYLKFRNKFDTEAWLALLTAATTAGSAGLDEQLEKSPAWVRLDSGMFRPAGMTDKETWTLQWVSALLRDFAGQIVYYDTHKWHLTRRSLLVLAVDLRKAHEELAKQRLCWWLRMIRERTRNADGVIESRVVLVGTHSDKLCPSTAVTTEGQQQLHQAQDALLSAIHDAFDLDPSEVVVGGEVLAVSSYNLDGIDRLSEKLQEVLTDPNGVTLVGNVQPSTYFVLEKIARKLAEVKPMVTLNELREEVCNQSHRIATKIHARDSGVSLSQEERVRLSQEEGVCMHLFNNKEAFDAALQYLNDTGSGMWFKDIIRDYVFIKPQWLTKLFARIEMQKHKGKCTLQRISPEGYDMLIRQGLLRLDLLQVLWKHDKRQCNSSLTLSTIDESSVRKLTLNALVSLMCHFEVMREVIWSSESPTDSTEDHSEPLVTEGASVASATTPSSLRGPSEPALPHATASSASTSVVSPKGHKSVFIPCMLNSVWGKDFEKWWAPWYITPLPGQRVMAVRLVVRQLHYSSISLMPEILKGVLPHLNLASKPILASDGLMMHGNEQLGGDRMTTMIFLRPCESGFFRIDVAIRKPWISSRIPAVAFEDVDVDQLYRIVLAQGWPQLAETLRAESATGKKLSGLDANDIRKLYQIPNDDVTLLMQAIQQWTAQGVPLQDIGIAAPVSPLHSMSEQLWIFMRAIADALPQDVVPSCQWLVLSPAMIAEQGLPMDDRSDVGWPFDEVIEARQRRLNLLCARTKHRVNYQEYFEAADMGNCGVDASECDFNGKTYTQRSIFSEQKDPDRDSRTPSATSPLNPVTSISTQVFSERKESLPEDARPHVVTGVFVPRPALSKQMQHCPKSPTASALTSHASASCTTSKSHTAASTSDSPAVSASASSVTSMSVSPAASVSLSHATPASDSPAVSASAYSVTSTSVSTAASVSLSAASSTVDSPAVSLLAPAFAAASNSILPAASSALAGLPASAAASALASASSVVAASHVASNSVAAAAPALHATSASAKAFPPATGCTEADWTWPAAAALRDDGGDATDKKLWHWRAVSGDNAVSKRTFFCGQSSHQLELVLSHWINHSDPMSTLRVERGDQQLAEVWRDLDKGGQEVEGICFDGRHGGLLQITAPTTDGWVELSRVRKGTKTEYPRMWNLTARASAVYAREDVPKESPEWRRVQKKLSSSLPGAELTGLERVQNPHTWDLFYRQCVTRHEEGDCHIDFTRAGSAVQELWHASGAIDILCKSKIGFDIRLAYRLSVMQKLKDIFGVGGHVYGYGSYFALHALYSHWWNTRVWRPKKEANDKSQYQLILAHVCTGKSKDYGGEWDPKLQMAPPGFHSVCGTESNQQVLPVKHFAGKGDLMAKTLLNKGDVYGKQFVVFESYQAYPMYVVTYTCPDDFKPRLMSPRTQRPMKWEHKSKREKTWTEYPPDHNMQLSQAFRDKERVVILDHEGKDWRVDLDKMEQKPVVQPFLQIRRRQVRYLNVDGHLS